MLILWAEHDDVGIVLGPDAVPWGPVENVTSALITNLINVAIGTGNL